MARNANVQRLINENDAKGGEVISPFGGPPAPSSPSTSTNISGYTPSSYLPGMDFDAKDNYSAQQSTEQAPKAPSRASINPGEDPPADISSAGSAPPTESVDVINDYDWTASINKQQLSEKIPYIRLTEYKITADNAVNAIAAGVFAWKDMQKSGAAALGKAASAAGSAADNFAFLKDVKDSKFAKVVASTGGTLSGTIDKYVTKATELAGKVRSPSNFGQEGQHLTDIYGTLYARESTGRTYTLPYFENEYFLANNTFEETTTAPFVNKAFDAVSKAANTLPALVEPGVYVQRPKFYKFDSDGNQFSFSFTLYNTITPLAYLKNSKLVQQLVLNNLPKRKTQIVVEPPCIYEVLIPGKAFFPYCFVKDLRVLHVGTKRLIAGEIVPDAFEVQITIKSLTTDASNFYERQMLHHGIGSAAPGDEAMGGPEVPAGVDIGGGTNLGESSAQREASLPSSRESRELGSALDRAGGGTTSEIYQQTADKWREHARTWMTKNANDPNLSKKDREEWAKVVKDAEALANKIEKRAQDTR